MTAGAPAEAANAPSGGGDSGHAPRAGELLELWLRDTRAAADRTFALVLVAQWAVAVGVAAVTAPAPGAAVGAALLGGTVAGLPAVLGRLLPGEPATRYAVAVGQVLLCALLTHLAGGRAGTQFLAFCSLAALALYLDVRVLLAASAVATLDLLLRRPAAASVYGPGYVAALALFVAILYVSVRQRLAGLRESAGRQAELEAAVTRAAETRAELEASEAQFRLFAHGVRQVLWLTDPRELRTLYVSPAYEAVWERPRAELYRDSLSYLSAVHPDDRPLLSEALARQAAGEPTNVEVRLSRPAADPRWVRISAFPMRDGRGQVFRVAAVSEEITERKQAEAERGRAFEREHRIASALQRSLLTEPEPRAFPGLEVGAFYRPARVEEALIGGDFFDAFPLGCGRVALAVGDVAGKGLDAAVQTAEAKYALRAYLRESSDPGDALGRLNRLLCEGRAAVGDQPSTFVALCVAVVDPAAGAARLSWAGAEPPVLRRADGGVEVIYGGGLPLGVMADADYASMPATLESGDLLVLYTDGVTEAHPPGGPILDTAGLCRLLASSAAPTVSETGERLLAALLEYSEGPRLRDDACLLLARRTATPAAGAG